MIEIPNPEAGMITPPKNIRQIGTPGGKHKIYMEDYVSTYLHSKVFRESAPKRVAVLLGKTGVYKEIQYTFISGAISCEELVFQEDTIQFQEKCWGYINGEIKKYFPQLSVMGWFLGVETFTPELTNIIEATHRKYFVGRDKIMMLSEFTEGEDIFYTYQQGGLQKKEGYYIYYEKNMPMQEYMVSAREKLQRNRMIYPEKIPTLSRQNKSISEAEQQKNQHPKKKEAQQMSSESPKQEKEQVKNQTKEKSQRKNIQQNDHREEITAAEEALRNYRSLFLERGESKNQKRMSTLLYTAASAAMIVLCVIGITTVNNYEKMKEVEETLQVMSGNSVTATVEKEVDTGEILIESVPGGVKKQEEKQQEQGEKAAVEEATVEEAAVEEAVVGEATVEEAAVGEATVEEAVVEEAAVGEATVEEAAVGEVTEVEEAVEAEESMEAELTTAEAVENGGEVITEEEAITEEPEVKTEQETVTTQGQASVEEAAVTVAGDYLEQGFYEVQPGDKLESICMEIYKTTAVMDKICQINEIEDTDKIYIGQKLMLP